MYVVNGSDGRCLVAVRLNSRCPLFRASVKGGSTVHVIDPHEKRLYTGKTVKVPQ